MPSAPKSMKVLKAILIFLGIAYLSVVLLALATFSVVKHLKIKDLVEQEIENELGIGVSIEKLTYSPLLTRIHAQGVTIHNPEGFAEGELAYLNSISVVWDVGDMVILKKPHIYLFEIDLERLNIIKNAQGKVNIKELVPVKDSQDAAKDRTPFFFDTLVLSVGRVTYTEYVPSGKKTRSFKIGIKDRVFVNLKDENEVIMLVIFKALQNTGIGKMIHFTMSPVFSGVSDTIDAAWGTAKTGAKSVFEIASMPFHLIFGT